MLTFASLMPPNYLKEDPLYGGLTKKYSILAFLFYVSLALLLDKYILIYFFIYVVIFVTLLAFVAPKMALFLCFVSPVLFSYIELVPSEFVVLFSVIIIWFLLFLAYVNSFIGREQGLDFLLLGGILTQTIVSLAFVFEYNILKDLFLYQSLVNKISPDSGYFNLCVIILILSAVLSPLSYIGFIKMLDNSSSSKTGFLQGLELLFWFIILVPIYMMNNIISLLLRKLLDTTKEELKWVRGEFLDKSAEDLFINNLKKDFLFVQCSTNPLLGTTQYLIIRINQSEIEKTILCQNVSFGKDAPLIMFNLQTLRGDKNFVKFMSNYMQTNGAIFLGRCHSIKGIEIERKLFSIYKQLVESNLMEPICMFRVKLRDIERDLNELSEIESKIIFQKINALEKEITWQEYLVKNESFKIDYLGSVTNLQSKITIKPIDNRNMLNKILYHAAL